MDACIHRHGTPRTRLESAEKGKNRRRSGMAQSRTKGGVSRRKVMAPRASDGASWWRAVVM